VRAAALLFAAALTAGCATIDVYSYQPRPLPSGSQPLAIVSWTLQDLRNVSWSYGEPDPDPSRHAELAATPDGVVGSAKEPIVAGSPLDLSYAEIAQGVRMVTQAHGLWTIYIYDRHNRLVQMEFSSYAAARLFLDASYALSRQS
jgi:hypothetical protein